jgi:hypothetical protein
MTKYDIKCTEITLFAIQTNTSAPCQRILLLESGSSGGNLGGAGGGAAAPTFVESDEFSEIFAKKIAFKRNPTGRTRIYKGPPPPPPNIVYRYDSAGA